MHHCQLIPLAKYADAMEINYGTGLPVLFENVFIKNKLARFFLKLVLIMPLS